MEGAFQAHPVPQNVTNFEFHLVGDMTLKQFGYLAAGLGLAFLLFVTLAQPLPLVAWPLIVMSAGIGAAFAFLPIQERPLDHWMAAFFRAIFKPTKLTYDEKIMKKEDPFFGKRLSMYMNSHSKATDPLPINPQSSPSMSGKKQSLADRMIANQDNINNQVQQEKEIDSMVASHVKQQNNPTLNPITAPLSTTPQPMVSSTGVLAVQTPPVNPAAPPAVSPLTTAPTPPVVEPITATSVVNAATVVSTPKGDSDFRETDLKKTVELAKDAQDTQSRIRQIEQQLSQIKSAVAKPGADPKFYLEQFQSLLTDLQKLNEHASTTAHDLALVSNTPDIQPQKKMAATPVRSIPTVKLTSFPNVVNGIVTDSQGNYVEGAIIVAHDKQGLPVRALKSNKLGQFVAATPLPNGTYTIVTEKENLLFDNVAIELKNEILQPAMISAKKQQLVQGVTGTV